LKAIRVRQFNNARRARQLRLTLVCEGLFDLPPALRPGLVTPASPGLEKLLARAGGHAAGDRGPLDFFPGSEQGEAGGLAAAALLGEGGDPGRAWWLRADPVHLQADLDHLRLVEPAGLALDEEGAQALIASFNAHFEADGLALHARGPERWYLRCAEALPAVTHAPARVSGRNLFHWMPEGEAGGRLRALINETQMLFHEHVVNRDRARRGLLPVSGVWPWGGGRLAAPRPGTWKKIWSDTPLIRGLGALQESHVAELTEDLHAWYAQAEAGRHLIWLAGDAPAARAGEVGAWRAALQRFEAAWFSPLWSLLAAGRLTAQLHLDGLGQFELDHLSRWRIWRRPRPPNRWWPEDE
jgi:hypothetical protein